MKRLLILSITLFATASLLACSNKKEYLDSIPCADILNEVEKQLPIELGYESYDTDHVKYNFERYDLDDDHALRYSVRSDNIDEFGIFHAPDEKAKAELLAVTESYIEEMKKSKRTFIESYAPNETPKLDSAEVRDYGNYVAYAVLSEDNCELFFETVERLLEK